jgi:hypothetical protein
MQTKLIRKFLQKVDEMDGRAAERPHGGVLTTLQKQKRRDAEKAFGERAVQEGPEKWPWRVNKRESSLCPSDFAK